jgi:mono/diheme cytochrome c family protein
MKIVLTIIICIIVACAGAVGFIYSGAFDVAAAQPDNPLLDWVLVTTRNQSVNARLASIQAPSNLDNPDVIAAGAKLFGQRCIVCHGGPGVQRGDISQGINPGAPNLFRAGLHRRAERDFWFVKNGVKMSAMPGFGETHPDDDIWSIVAFLRIAPGMSAQDFATRTGRALPPAPDKPTGG